MVSYKFLNCVVFHVILGLSKIQHTLSVTIKGKLWYTAWAYSLGMLSIHGQRHMRQGGGHCAPKFLRKPQIRAESVQIWGKFFEKRLRDSDGKKNVPPRSKWAHMLMFQTAPLKYSVR